MLLSSSVRDIILRTALNIHSRIIANISDPEFQVRRKLTELYGFLVKLIQLLSEMGLILQRAGHVWAPCRPRPHGTVVPCLLAQPDRDFRYE
jgi:hypothetical protein